MNRRYWVLAAWFALAHAMLAQDPRQVIEEVQKRNRSQSQRYEGTLEVIDSRNRTTTKRWTYERIGSFGRSKSVLRFTDPPEVKGVALLVHNHPDRSSDQWMWTPALQRDRRVALQDRSTRFFGTDFSFEDLEERDVDQFDYRLLASEKIDGADCWKIESRPRAGKTSQYTHSYVWVDKGRMVILQVEGWKNDDVIRRIAYREFEHVKGIWTARRMEVLDTSRKSRTVMKLENLDYNIPVREEDYTLQALRRGGPFD